MTLTIKHWHSLKRGIAGMIGTDPNSNRIDNIDKEWRLQERQVQSKKRKLLA